MRVSSFLSSVSMMTNRSSWWRLVPIAALTVAIGCHGVLDVSDPTLIQDSDIANSAGANAQRLFASSTFMNDILTVVSDVAYFTDEWTTDTPAGIDLTYNWNALLDQRNTQGLDLFDTKTNVDIHLGTLSHSYWQTTLAIKAVRANAADSLKPDYLGQLYAIRGYLMLQMAEDLCGGFPINDVEENRTTYGGPLTTDSAMAWAGHVLDSAVKYARDSVRFVTLARVLKGRAYLDQGKYDSAAAVVASVATEDRYTTEANRRIVMDISTCVGCFATALGNGEGGNGVHFAAPGDPRIPLWFLAVRQANPHDSLFVTTMGRNPGDVLTLASGIEARLIEAEAALHDGNPSWKTILDDLRATVGLDTLVDPGTPDSRLTLLYDERARWLLMTGRRLGDMRRLVRNYGRSAESVFPAGVWPGGTGVNYGAATAIPFNLANQGRYNPNITSGCQAGP